MENPKRENPRETQTPNYSTIRGENTRRLTSNNLELIFVEQIVTVRSLT